MMTPEQKEAFAIMVMQPDGDVGEQILEFLGLEGDPVARNAIEALRPLCSEFWHIHRAIVASQVLFDRVAAKRRADFEASFPAAICPYCKAGLDDLADNGHHFCPVGATAPGGHTRVTYISTRAGVIAINQRITALCEEAKNDG